jgi:hypothetical protein
MNVPLHEDENNKNIFNSNFDIIENFQDLLNKLMPKLLFIIIHSILKT